MAVFRGMVGVVDSHRVDFDLALLSSVSLTDRHRSWRLLGIRGRRQQAVVHPSPGPDGRKYREREGDQEAAC